MIDSLISSLHHYFYIEYILAVVLITATVRSLVKGLDNSLHPKWITLVVGIVMAIVGYVVKTFTYEAFSVFKVIGSFGAATIGYDYFWKVLKDSFSK
jgi:hypothetical protein